MSAAFGLLARGQFCSNTQKGGIDWEIGPRANQYAFVMESEISPAQLRLGKAGSWDAISCEIKCVSAQMYFRRCHKWTKVMISFDEAVASCGEGQKAVARWRISEDLLFHLRVISSRLRADITLALFSRKLWLVNNGTLSTLFISSYLADRDWAFLLLCHSPSSPVDPTNVFLLLMSFFFFSSSLVFCSCPSSSPVGPFKVPLGRSFPYPSLVGVLSKRSLVVWFFLSLRCSYKSFNILFSYLTFSLHPFFINLGSSWCLSCSRLFQFLSSSLQAQINSHGNISQIDCYCWIENLFRSSRLHLHSRCCESLFPS